MEIVVGYDGSDEAKKGLEQAALLAGPDGRVNVVSVVFVYPQFGRAAVYVDPDEDAERKRELSEAVGVLSARGVKVHAQEGHGDPADVIVETAKDVEADLVIVGSRGLSAVQRWLMGSVSSKVVAHAPCSVLVVR